MNIKRFLQSHSRGQSLAFVAIISIALFGILALALDFGYTMYNRRWAQNAADSGALAAARILCTDNTINRVTNATNAAREYVEDRNLAFGVISQQMTQICIYGDPNIPAGCAGASLDKGQAEVTVAIEHPTFVASFFGTNSITVPAVAQAGCFAPGGITGAAVVPVAWECDTVTCSTNPTTGETTCTCGGLQYTTGNCALGQSVMYIFFDIDKYYWCTDEWGSVPLVGGVPDPNAIPIDCDDESTPPSPDVHPISPLNPEHKWFWANVDGNNCDATELVDIVRYGLTTDMFTHVWYPECTGDKGTVYDNLDTYRDNTRAIVPVFDRQCQATDPTLTTYDAFCHAGPRGTTLVPPDLENDTIAGSPGNSTTNWYHMIGAAVLDIKCVEDPNSQCKNVSTNAREWLEKHNPAPGPGNQSLIGNESSFEGCFVDEYVPGLFGRPSDGVVTGAWTIYLVK